MVLMGTIKPSKDQALVAGDSKMDSKGKKKDNPKKPSNQNKDNSKSHEESSSSKKNSRMKKGKGEMNKCTYCGKGYHTYISCMTKQIGMLTQILEKHNISLPEGTMKEGASNFEYKERLHALVGSTVRYPSFIIDSGASRLGFDKGGLLLSSCFKWS